MNSAPRTRAGFTIVELIIVIVVVGILAAIATVAYTGIQEKARDTRRLVDMKHITQALEVYRAKFGQFPVHQSPSGSWETSSAYSTNFLNSLVTSNIVESVPVDPKNSSNNYYRYYRYSAGTGGCDVSKGAFYVLQIRLVESDVLRDANPGHVCPTRNWTNEMASGYTVAGFENQ